MNKTFPALCGFLILSAFLLAGCTGNNNSAQIEANGISKLALTEQDAGIRISETKQISETVAGGKGLTIQFDKPNSNIVVLQIILNYSDSSEAKKAYEGDKTESMSSDGAKEFAISPIGEGSFAIGKSQQVPNTDKILAAYAVTFLKGSIKELVMIRGFTTEITQKDAEELAKKAAAKIK